MSFFYPSQLVYKIDRPSHWPYLVFNWYKKLKDRTIGRMQIHTICKQIMSSPTLIRTDNREVDENIESIKRKHRAPITANTFL